MIEAVVLDVGETLVDETREYGTWADWLGIPRHTFSAVFGAVIALAWTIGRYSSISGLASAWTLNVHGARRRATGMVWRG